MFVKNITGNTESTMNIECPQLVSLKRSSSAPMINEITAAMSINATSTPPRDAVTTFHTFLNMPRTRRFSTSSPGSGIGIGISPRLAPRVNQLRQEECIEVVAGREVAHEKEIHSAMQISQSWEDLTFETEGLSCKDTSIESPPLSLVATSSILLPQLKTEKQIIPRKIFDPLNLNLSANRPSLCSSPSPTRTGLGQCQRYSPNFHAMTWKNGSLSPSPTRKAFATRRSLSPISIRPSCLGGTTGALKRKFELDENVDRVIQPPIKRAFNLLRSNPSRVESMLTSSINTNSTGSVRTPEFLSSTDSRNCLDLLVDASSSSSKRVLSPNDDANMSDNSDDPQQNKSMEADVQSNQEKNPHDDDNR